jgi:indole-3-glycerol phosphate synthase
MRDYLDVLARVAQINVDDEYYDQAQPSERIHVSLKQAILNCKAAPVISEIKAASPSAGVIRSNIDAGEIAKAMQRGGATGLSVLTEPRQFSGSLEALAQARGAVKLPILMKDIIVSPVQIQSAYKMGANAVLLIQALFDRGYIEKSVDEMILGAHLLGLEVLLETHTKAEFCSAVTSGADLVGINNRNLSTLKVDLGVTKRILAENGSNGKLVVSESGINTTADIEFLKQAGARAFLIGSAIMSSSDIEQKVKEFVNAK